MTTTFKNIDADHKFFVALAAAVEFSTAVTVEAGDYYLTLIAPRDYQHIKVLGVRFDTFMPPMAIETPRGDAGALEEVLGSLLYNKSLNVRVQDGELDKFTVWKETEFGGIRVRAFC